MRVQNLLFPVLACVTGVCADVAVIIQAVKDVNQATIALNSTINELSGHFLGDSLKLIQLGHNTASLYDKTGIACKMAEKSANLTEKESYALGGYGLKLYKSVNTTLESMIRAESKIRADRIASTIGPSLKLQKQQSARFSTLVVRITPETDKATAIDLGEWIAASFDKALAVFN